MKIYIELWNAKESWSKCSVEEKSGYLSQIEPALQDLVIRGVEIIAWAKNGKGVSHRIGYDFISILKFPNDTLINEFETLVEESGWYDYFDQVNASGTIIDLKEAIKMMVDA